MRHVFTLFIAIATVSAFSLAHTSNAAARPPYNKAFKEKYLTEGSKMAEALGDQSSCNICHVGMTKKKRNDYGSAFGKLVKKEGIDGALTKVAKQPSSAKDKSSPTFGDLIEEGKLPITK